MRITGNKLKHIIGFFHTELAGIYDVSEIEAQLKVAINHYLGFNSTELVTKAEENINQSDLLKLYDCARALKEYKPLQLILGETEFYHLKFFVTGDVLIPRPETEELVDLVLKEDKTVKRILDIGTGSGCIAVALKKNLPAAQVFACDISQAALEVAGRNAKRNNTPVHFLTADALVAGIIEKEINVELDLIISNPPYIHLNEKSTMAKHVLDHEPHLALFVEGNDPVIFYKKIIDLCRQKLKTDGKLYFELNPLTAEDVERYANDSGIFKKVTLLQDMSGSTRFMKATKK